MAPRRAGYERGRHFQLTADEVIELYFPDHSDDEILPLDQDDIDVLEEIPVVNQDDQTEVVIALSIEDRDSVTQEVVSLNVDGRDFDNVPYDFEWSKRVQEPVQPAISAGDNPIDWGQLSNNLLDGGCQLSPYEIFNEVSKFENLIANIVVPETNRYAAQNGVAFETNADEIKAYIAICIIMGYHKLPAVNDYWSTDIDLGIPAIQNVMARARFWLIRANIHFCDNSIQPERNDPTYDKGHKINRVIDHVNNAFQKAMASTNRQSIDERMVKFKGHNSLKQYIKNKPVKWGFKFWVHAESITGYVLEIKLYSGKGTGYVKDPYQI